MARRSAVELRSELHPRSLSGSSGTAGVADGRWMVGQHIEGKLVAVSSEDPSSELHSSRRGRGRHVMCCRCSLAPVTASTSSSYSRRDMTASRSRIRSSLEYRIVYLGCTVSGNGRRTSRNVEFRGVVRLDRDTRPRPRLGSLVDTPSKMPVRTYIRTYARWCNAGVVHWPDQTTRPPGRPLEHIE